jgi:hypothetical protein
MNEPQRLSSEDLAQSMARIAGRPLLLRSPTIRFVLAPGDRALVVPGDVVLPGIPIAERTRDTAFVDVGRIAFVPAVEPTPAAPESGSVELEEVRPPEAEAADESDVGAELAPSGEAQRSLFRGDAAKSEPEGPSRPGAERRSPPFPGKWWVGGVDLRGRSRHRRTSPRRVAGTLLFEIGGKWQAASGERHEFIEAPAAGVIQEARNGIHVTMTLSGIAIPAAVGAGGAARGYLDVPRLTDGELWASALDVGRAGAIVVAGSRISAQGISRARAMSIRGLIAASVGQGELRDMAASEARQRASLHQLAPFGLLAFDGHQRRPMASPVLALLAALAGRDVAIVTDPPMLVFDVDDVALPEIASDWVRVRSGPYAGREGRYLGPAGMYRFRVGIHLDAAFVRLGDDLAPTVVPMGDLERFV